MKNNDYYYHAEIILRNEQHEIVDRKELPLLSWRELCEKRKEYEIALSGKILISEYIKNAVADWLEQ